MGEAWLVAFFVLVDILCQLDYMIYITNANTSINILSITHGREYRLFVAHN